MVKQQARLMKSQIGKWATAWNKGNLNAADHFFADNFVYNGAVEKWNLLELKEFYAIIKRQNRGARVKVDNLIFDGNKFGINWTVSNKKKVVSKGAGTGVFKNGKLASFTGVTTD